MNNLRNKAKDLLENKTVNVVIGYSEGSDNAVRAAFITDPGDVQQLIFDERCVQNLAFYLMKHEVKHYGKIAIAAPLPVMRTILQITSECQVKEENIVVLGISPEGSYIEFNNFKDLETYIATANLSLPDADALRMKEIEAMTQEQRWEFWTNELSRCMKCYACRAACPMCYCTRCQVECNDPQWVTVEATPLGNLEWHLMRGMHLAGRCVNCGECARACPLHIPINLLTYRTVQSVKNNFNVAAGTSASMESVLSSFNSNDKENFIR